MDHRTQELVRRLHQGDLSLIEPVIRSYLRAGIPLTSLVNSDNAFSGLLDPQNLQDQNFLQALVSPAKHHLMGIYLKHTLGYVFNDNPDWCDFFIMTDPARSKKTKESVCSSLRDNLRKLVQELLLWTPETEIALETNAGKISKIMNMLILSFRHDILKLELNDENPSCPDLGHWIIAFEDLIKILPNRYAIERADFIVEVIRNCQDIAASAANITWSELFNICAPDILHFIYTTDTTQIRQWFIRISVEPLLVGNIPEFTAPIRNLLNQHSLHFIEDESFDQDQGLLWSFFDTEFIGSTDAVAALVRELRSNLPSAPPGGWEDWQIDVALTLA